VGLPPLSVQEAEAIHLAVMEEYPEEPSGILDRGLLESILHRPVHTAAYQEADECAQAATLLWGLIRSHAFVQGNKRTATAIAFFFLERAGYTIATTDDEILELVYAINEGKMPVEEVAGWLRVRSQPPG